VVAIRRRVLVTKEIGSNGKAGGKVLLLVDMRLSEQLTTRSRCYYCYAAGIPSMRSDCPLLLRPFLLPLITPSSDNSQPPGEYSLSSRQSRSFRATENETSILMKVVVSKKRRFDLVYAATHIRYCESYSFQDIWALTRLLFPVFVISLFRFLSQAIIRDRYTRRTVFATKNMRWQ